jgi:hypothetical protein
MENPYQIAAYTDIGRAVVAWGQFEQLIITQTWKSRDPHHLSPFREGAIESGFYKRWLEWCRIFAAPEALKLEVLSLSEIRDDLCHNIFLISPSGNPYSLGIYKRHFDWRTGFQRWAAKFSHLHFRARPPAPKDTEYFHKTPREIAAFVANVEAAKDAVRDTGDEWLDRQQGSQPSS